jgi:Flp pilus assembly protein CpaB
VFFAGAVGVLAIVISAAPASETFVVRSSKAIAPLTGLDVTQFTVIAVDPDSVESGAVSGESSEEALGKITTMIEGKWFLYPVADGQQIRETMLVEQGSLAVPLDPTERLISITARAASAVSGTIRPGNKVDIYVSDGEGLTGVLGQDVEIVAVSLPPEQFDSVAQQQFNDPEKSLSDFVAAQPVGGTYVIRVSASEVARYIAADTAGKITLALHGAEAQGFTPAPTDLYNTVCGNSVSIVCNRGGGE